MLYNRSRLLDMVVDAAIKQEEDELVTSIEEFDAKEAERAREWCDRHLDGLVQLGRMAQHGKPITKREIKGLNVPGNSYSSDSWFEPGTKPRRENEPARLKSLRDTKTYLEAIEDDQVSSAALEKSGFANIKSLLSR